MKTAQRRKKKQAHAWIKKFVVFSCSGAATEYRRDVVMLVFNRLVFSPGFRCSASCRLSRDHPKREVPTCVHTLCSSSDP